MTIRKSQNVIVDNPIFHDYTTNESVIFLVVALFIPLLVDEVLYIVLTSVVPEIRVSVAKNKRIYRNVIVTLSIKIHKFIERVWTMH